MNIISEIEARRVVWEQATGVKPDIVFVGGRARRAVRELASYTADHFVPLGLSRTEKSKMMDMEIVEVDSIPHNLTLIAFGKTEQTE